jgi:hypothetical protein
MRYESNTSEEFLGQVKALLDQYAALEKLVGTMLVDCKKAVQLWDSSSSWSKATWENQIASWEKAFQDARNLAGQIIV